MKLLQFELRKCLFNRRSVAVIAVLFAVYIAGGFGASVASFGGAAGYKAYSELATAAAGPYNAEQAAVSEAAYNAALAVYGNADYLARLSLTNPELRFHLAYNEYAASVSAYWNGPEDGQDLSNIMGVYPLQKKIGELESENPTGAAGTYDHKRYSARLETELAAGEPEFQNTALWDSFLSNCSGMVAFILLFFPIAFLTAPVFTNERTTGMDNIILSSKNGQGKTILAKISAAAVTCALLSILYFAGTFIGTFLPFGAFAGFDLPVRTLVSLSGAQITMSIGAFAVLTLFWLVFATIVFAVILTLVSSVCSRQAAVFAIGILILLANLMIKALGTAVTDALDIVIQFGFLNTAGAATVFGGNSTFNVFGHVVPYSVMAIMVMMIAALTAAAGVMIRQKRRVVV
jgi:ABC-type transport system involved in multi-copper enzyme maturation permease subunit